jgi:hypothetical protein
MKAVPTDTTIVAKLLVDTPVVIESDCIPGALIYTLIFECNVVLWFKIPVKLTAVSLCNRFRIDLEFTHLR